ncbi:TPA: ATP-binding protein [Pasteurella multocida]|nr:ATP-binding protein [Pasteurella multocida]
MKLQFSNIAKINTADIELGKLTILCGKNNTGKTHLTYSIYGLLKHLSELEFSLNTLRKYFNEAIDSYSTEIPLSEIKHSVESEIIRYSEKLKTVLAVNELNNPVCKINNLGELINVDRSFSVVGRFRSNKESVHLIQYNKEQKNDFIKITYTPSDLDDSFELTQQINRRKTRLLSTIEHQFKIILIKEIVKMIPSKVFISSVERTGIAIFKEELDGLIDKDHELFGFLDHKDIFKGTYPSAVMDNINAVKRYHSLENQSNSKLYKDAPFILKYFQEIIGGEYKLNDSVQSINYVPKSNNGKTTELSLIESSSSIRSLLDIGIYLKYFADKGQTLVIDEPEINLHPSNQRKIARLLAMLVNYGISVIVTTHSDFITRELSFLVMMKDPKRKNILEEEVIKNEYSPSQLLNANDIKVYSSYYDNNTNSISIRNEKVSFEDGFTIPTFDDTIDKMNEIYNTIL